MFTNVINLNEYDTTQVKKIIPDKEIVCTTIELKEEKEGLYNIDIKIPLINIDGEIPAKFNETTTKYFVEKANAILSGTSINTIYNVKYTATVVNDILSIAIQSTLKEGGNAQRIILQTYNYNLKTNKEATIQEMLQLKNITPQHANEQIEKVVNDVNKQAESLSSMGYSVYIRDLTDLRYKVDNVTSFMLDSNENLYIIYPYGNEDFTSEMDIIVF